MEKIKNIPVTLKNFSPGEILDRYYNLQHKLSLEEIQRISSNEQNLKTEVLSELSFY